MKTLHFYLVRQVIVSLLMTVAVFTFVLMLGNALKEVLPLLVTGQVKFLTVVKAIALLVPFVWVYALPMGMLTATLLIFGRFSADQELTAVRASGVSLLTLVAPVLVLSLVLCGLSGYVNMYLGPRCRAAYTDMIGRLRLELSSGVLPEGRFIKDFPGYIFYAGKNRDGNLQDVIVFVLNDRTNVNMTVRAARGRIELDAPNQRLKLWLFDARLITVNEGRAIPASQEEWELEFNFKPPEKAQLGIDDMTFPQLRKELRHLEWITATPMPLRGMTVEEMDNWRTIWRQQKKDICAPVIFHMHRQMAFSFACFGFTLVGIPLGIRVHRRETNIGIGIALLLVAAYYSFFLLAQSFENHPEWAPHLIVWLPDFIFQAAGAVLLWRANRGV